MKNTKFFTAMAVVALLLISNFCVCGATSLGKPSPSIRNTTDEDILQAYMAFTSDVIYYMSLRQKAYDTEEQMSLESRLMVVEDLILYAPRLESSLSSLRSVTAKASDIGILNMLSSQASMMLLGEDGKFSEILKPYMALDTNMEYGLDSVEAMLEYDKEDLMGYAAAIYSKQLMLGKASKDLDSYLEELRERYEQTRKCISVGRQKAIFSMVSLSLEAPYFAFLPSPSGVLDSDKDGLSDHMEDRLGTDKLSADTDADGLSDYDEIYLYSSNPLNADSDNDGMSDGEEIKRGTNPNKNEIIYLPTDNPFYSVDDDTDQDGISDIVEVAIGTNMLHMDTDRDGILDGIELEMGLDPLSKDTDGDGLSDLKDLFPLDPERGGGGINLHDNEEVFMAVFGVIAVSAAIASLFGCPACIDIAVEASIQVIELYEREQEEKRNGTDE